MNHKYHSHDLDAFHGIVEWALFGAAVWALLAFVYFFWVSPALSKPENPLARVRADFYAAISGERR